MNRTERDRRWRRTTWEAQDGRCLECREPAGWYDAAQGRPPENAAMLTMRRGVRAVVCFRCTRLGESARSSCSTFPEALRLAPLPIEDAPMMHEHEERA